MRFVDLSQDIYEGMMVYPGHNKTVVFDHATHAETSECFDSEFSFQTKGLMINDNGPTHVDSFSHLDPDPEAQTIDQMDLNLFYGPAVCLDVSHVPARTDITADDLDNAEQTTTVTVEPGDILLLHTGTHTRYAGLRSTSTSIRGSANRRASGSPRAESRPSAWTARPRTIRSAASTPAT